MFGAKTGGFGQPNANTGFGTFGNNPAATSPFGQTTAFSKPVTTGAFGATPTFGQQPTTSLFGPTQPAGGLFGASTSNAPTFGGPTAAQPGFSAFGQQQPQTTSLFGTQNNTAANTSLFGNNNNTSFGAAKPAGFGFGQTSTQSSLFGQASTSQTTTSGFFGQNTQSGGLFGAAKPAFGAAPAVAGGNGTAVAKYQQTHGTDTLVKNGTTTTINTKQHCITFMKDYENKSVEELRFEDYVANRKGPQAGAPGGGLFGGGAQTTGLFGTTTQQTSGLFGQNAAAPATGGLFGTSTNTFGATTTPPFGTTAGSTFGKPFGNAPATSAPGFGFAQSTTSTLGGLGANKPAFGAAGTGLFGQTATPATNTFGQTSAFGGFGTQNTATQPGGLFSGAGTAGAAPATGAFGTLAPSTGTSFSFGSNTQTNQPAGSTLFGAKPANTFGTLGGTTFGQNVTSVAPSFGFGTNTNTAGTGGSFFGSSFNKPAAPAFGLGSTAPAGGLGAGGGLTFGTGTTSLFGNTANKPGGLGTGTSLFGNTSTLGTAGGAFGSLGMGSSFGTGGMGGAAGVGGIGMMTSPTGQQTVPIHQQILAMATSPYGDNPIFKGIKPLAGPTEDSLKPTNPSAQKAILEGSNYHFKVSSRSGSADRVKVKPLGAAQLKKSIFDGLEEYDSTLEDSFTLKPNAKRLIIKPRSVKPTIVIPESDTVDGSTVTEAANSPTTIYGRSTSSQRVAEESFRNQIPINPAESAKQQNDGNRRVSWLQSNVLDKVRQQQSSNPRLSESVLDNTIKEFASVSNNRNEKPASSSPGTIREESILIGETDAAAKAGSRGLSGTSPTAAATGTNQTANESFISNRSFLNETSLGGGIGTDLSTSVPALVEDAEPHPTGIVLRRTGYYTIPSLDEIAQLMDDEGRCIVANFTIGRKGYGNVYFNEPIDVAGLNLDEIVHFRHKEVIIYPDDENKPPVGSGLNRKAQITLDQVWPHDKTLHEPIKDPQRLALMDYEAKLRRVCDKHDTRFLEYRPDTGSWVFKVEHFSKYGLSDSDDEDAGQVDPKKLKMMTTMKKVKTTPKQQWQPPQQQQQQRSKTQQTPGTSPTSEPNSNASSDRRRNVTDDDDGTGRRETFEDDLSPSRYTTLVDDENGNFSAHNDTATSPTAAIALEMGTDPHKIQLMKASFFGDDEFDGGRDSPDQIVPGGGTGGSRSAGASGGLLLQSLYGAISKPTPKDSMPFGSGVERYNKHTLLHAEGLSTIGFTPGSLLKTSTAKTIQVDGESTTGSLESSLQTAHKLSQRAVGGTKVVALPPIPRPVGPQSLPLLIEPRIETLQPMTVVIPLSKSILRRFLANKSNLAFFHGRKFKVGWANGSAMVLLNTRNNCSELSRCLASATGTGGQSSAESSVISIDSAMKFFRGRGNEDYSPAALQVLRLHSTAAPSVTLDALDFHLSIECHLRVQLRHVEHRSVAAGGGTTDCPMLVAGGKYSNLEDHCEQARSLHESTGTDYDELCADVWSLLVALWGAREELEGVEDGAHLSTMFRRDLFSEWIERVVTDRSQKERKQAEKRDYLDQLLELIRTHKVLEACDLAFESNDLQLALLIAQISGGPAVRQLLQRQLCAWQDSEADRFIDPRRLQVFMAIAGVPVMASSHGAINLFESVDWMKSLAMHLWYLSTPTASITDALIGYEHSFESTDFYTLPPVPPYTRRFQPNAVGSGDRAVRDVRFHLLKLYSRRSHPLEPLLNPASHTADPTDHRLSWLLLQALETLGYRHCSEFSRSQLHVAFANQLESYGLWQWSVFVLLHLQDQARRELTVQQLLYRHVQLDDDENYLTQERFVIKELGIPEKWIHWAKAVKAGSMFDHRQQAHYLLQAKQWSLAHEVILLHLAPEFVMNDKIVHLKGMLDAIENPKQISSWATKGQILSDFIELNEKFELIKETIDDAMVEQRLEELKPKLSDLCSVIKMFPCPTPKHVLLQSEISHRLAYFVRTFFMDDPQISGSALMRGALERLPLPEEYVMGELDHMLRAFLAEELHN